MFVIGITGGIGCGKSTAARYFKEKGITVLDADKISFEVTQAEGIALDEIKLLFGAEIIDANGGMNRAEVARIVFDDKKRLDKLSAIVHRHVLAQMAAEIKTARQRKEKICVLDVPIPVKEGFLDQCDYVLVIWAEEAKRIARLAGRGMSESEARRRIAMQMTRTEYAALANEVIENNSDIESLYQALDEFYERELVSRGIRF